MASYHDSTQTQCWTWKPFIPAVTVFHQFCGALSRDGSGKASFDLRKLRKAGICAEHIPADLKEVAEALNKGCEDKIVTSVKYDKVLIVVYWLRSLTESLGDIDSNKFFATPCTDYYPAVSILLRLSEVEMVSAIKFWQTWPMARWVRDAPEGAGLLTPAFLKTANRSDLRQWLHVDESTGVEARFALPFAGSLRAKMKNLVASRTTSRPANVFCTGMLQGAKRGCAPVPELFQLEACVKHKKSLSQIIPFDFPEEFEEKFEQVFFKDSTDSQTWRNEEGVWRKKLEPRSFERRLRNPKSHASFGSVRSDGGRCGEIHRVLRDRADGEELVCPSPVPCLPEREDTGWEDFRYMCREVLRIKLGDKELSGTSTSKKQHKNSGWRTEDMTKRLGGLPLLDMVELHPGNVYTRYALPILSYKQVLNFVQDIVPEGRPLEAAVACCLEPLKCRVITKGEGFPYWLSQTFQREARDILRETPAFCLTKETVNTSHIWALDRATRALGLDFDQWVSGDYKAATDGLSLGVNQCCLRVLLKALGATRAETLICQKVLGAHKISYPDKLCALVAGTADQLDDFMMTNGQLMGSLLSFPVLCAINLVAYWLALEEYSGRKFSLDELPVLVNGDDILFRANTEFYAVWQTWITRAGFTLSDGKNYISPNYLTVNSKSWMYKPVKGKEPIIEEIGYLNCGLLLAEAEGPVRPGIREETACKPFIAKMQEALDGCNNPGRTFNRLKHHYKKKIEIETAQRTETRCRWVWNSQKTQWDKIEWKVNIRPGFYNLCAARELGGLGLKVPLSLRHEVHFTRTQQKIAGAAHRWYRRHNNYDLPPRGCHFVAMGGNSGNPFTRVVGVDDPASSYDLTDPIGYPVLCREITEPCRYGEIPVEDAVRKFGSQLLSCQTATAGDQPSYRIRDITQQDLDEHVFTNKNARLIKNPFDFNLCFRAVFDRGPTDEASPWPGDPLRFTFDEESADPKMAEMATTFCTPPQALYRTDSYTVDPVFSGIRSASRTAALDIVEELTTLIQSFLRPSFVKVNPTLDQHRFDLAAFHFGSTIFGRAASQPWEYSHAVRVPKSILPYSTNSLKKSTRWKLYVGQFLAENGQFQSNVPLSQRRYIKGDPHCLPTIHEGRERGRNNTSASSDLFDGYKSD